MTAKVMKRHKLPLEPHIWLGVAAVWAAGEVGHILRGPAPLWSDVCIVLAVLTSLVYGVWAGVRDYRLDRALRANRSQALGTQGVYVLTVAAFIADSRLLYFIALLALATLLIPRMEAAQVLLRSREPRMILRLSATSEGLSGDVEVRGGPFCLGGEFDAIAGWQLDVLMDALAERVRSLDDDAAVALNRGLPAMTDDERTKFNVLARAMRGMSG